MRPYNCNGAIWVLIGAYASLRISMGPYGSFQILMRPYGI